MIQSLSESSWAKPAFFSAVLAGCVLLWVYLTGGVFLHFAGQHFADADLLTAWRYWHHYGHQAETSRWLGISATLAAVAALLPVAFVLRPTRRSLYGDARFATALEIRRAKLTAEKGIIVGKRKGRYLSFGGQQHVLMAAPTRSGKGVGMVIPNLLNWPESAVVLDVKQENWDITAGFRAKHGQKCFLFNPEARDYRTHRWNPLHYISDDPHFRITDIQTIGQMLFPDNEREAPIWQASSRSLFLGVVIYLLETDELPVTLGEVLRQVTSGDDTYFTQIIEKRQAGEKPLSAECVGALNDYLNTSAQTRSSIRKTFTSALELWFNPVVDSATAGNDFDLRELRARRMSIYVGIAPGSLERLSRLLNLFFQQVIELNTRELPERNPALKYQTLLLMDEFAAIGKNHMLMKSLTYIAGYGLRLLPIIQSPAQIRDIYGHDAADTFMDNHALRVIFAPKNNKDAKEISEMLGDTTVKGRTKSRNVAGKESRSISTSDQRRALLLPQELRALGAARQIIMTEDCPPILCRKIRYYREKVFKTRLVEPPEMTLLQVEKKEAPAFVPPSDSGEDTTIERDVTTGDIERIEELNLENFSCDFSNVEIPSGEISEQQMTQIVDQFFEGLEPGSAP